jgi:hypothetical protein
MTGPLDHLRTLDQIRDYICSAYRQVAPPPGSERAPALLPLAVAEPAVLIERAVELCGPEGISKQELRTLFGLVGSERYERGLALARAAGRIDNTWEQRSPPVGPASRQLVFRPLSP